MYKKKLILTGCPKDAENRPFRSSTPQSSVTSRTIADQEQSRPESSSRIVRSPSITKINPTAGQTSSIANTSADPTNRTPNLGLDSTDADMSRVKLEPTSLPNMDVQNRQGDFRTSPPNQSAPPPVLVESSRRSGMSARSEYSIEPCVSLPAYQRQRLTSARPSGLSPDQTSSHFPENPVSTAAPTSAVDSVLPQSTSVPATETAPAQVQSPEAPLLAPAAPPIQSPAPVAEQLSGLQLSQIEKLPQYAIDRLISAFAFLVLKQAMATIILTLQI